jgi:hypothetical protein
MLLIVSDRSDNPLSSSSTFFCKAAISSLFLRLIFCYTTRSCARFRASWPVVRCATDRLRDRGPADTTMGRVWDHMTHLSSRTLPIPLPLDKLEPVSSTCDIYQADCDDREVSLLCDDFDRVLEGWCYMSAGNGTAKLSIPPRKAAMETAWRRRSP